MKMELNRTSIQEHDANVGNRVIVTESRHTRPTFLGCLAAAALWCAPATSPAQQGPSYLSAPNGSPERALIVTPKGYVGIGTESPIAPLQLTENANNPFLALRPAPNTDTADSFTEIRFYGDAYTVTNRYAAIRQVNSGGSDQNELAFLTAYVDAPVERMRIDDHGNVGIGTAFPRTKLAVRADREGAIFGVSRVGSDVEALQINVSGETPYLLANNANLVLGINNPGGTGGPMPAVVIGDRSGNVRIGTALTEADAKLQVDGKLRCEVLEVTSDRNAKTKFASLKRSEVLDKLLRLQISEWEYTNAPGVRHFGAMAQDFHATFGLGSDDKHINPLDAASAALLGVQALAERLQERDQRLAVKEAEIASLQLEVATFRKSMLAQRDLVGRIARLEKLVAGVGPAPADPQSSSRASADSAFSATE